VVIAPYIYEIRESSSECSGRVSIYFEFEFNNDRLVLYPYIQYLQINIFPLDSSCMPLLTVEVEYDHCRKTGIFLFDSRAGKVVIGLMLLVCHVAR
jgi:hypothetical protein